MSDERNVARTNISSLSPASVHEAERRYLALFNSIDQGFCTIEVLFDDAGEPYDYRFLETNPAFVRQTGIEDGVGRTVREFAPEHERFWFEIYGRIVKTGEALRFEHEAATLNPPRYYDVYAFRIGEPENNHVAVLFSDISERKRTEAVLRESEERKAFLLGLSDALRPLVDPTEVMAVAADALGHYLGVGRCGYGEVDNSGDIFTVRRDWTDGLMASLEGSHQMADFGPEFGEAYRSGRTVILEDALADARAAGAEEAFEAAGGLRASLGMPLLKGGRLVAIFYVQQIPPRHWTPDEEALVREVAERTWAAVDRARAEEALRESEHETKRARDYAEATLRTSPVPLLVLETDLRVKTANDAFYEVFQVDLVETEGRLVYELGNGQWNIPKLRELLEDVLPKRTVLRGFEVTHDFESIGRRTMLLNARRMENEPGLLERIVLVLEDITERKQAVEAIRQSEAALREADRRKDEFLAMLAHELRNPLAPIRTGLELIRLAGDTPGSVERVRAMMERQIGHMVRLIDDLLDVSRITSGKIQLQREPTPLDTLVNSAIEANRAAMAAKQIELSVDLPETLCVLDVDPTRFVQVVSNLLHNATKFTDPGGSIGVSARVIDEADSEVQQLTLSVIDSGIGIAPQLLPRVFDLFMQGDRESSQPGLGLGLALARRLVEMHGGQIHVCSEGPGRGSEFVIRLPLSTQVPHRRAAQNIGPSRVDCRVMVIDDNRDAATVMAMLVEELGGECRTAYDGESGLREVLNYRPDVVLLDIGMPGLDGYETCRRIRLEFGGEVMVVAVTGFGQEQDQETSARAGFDAHLTKPADPMVLEKLLRRCRSRGMPHNNDVA